MKGLKMVKLAIYGRSNKYISHFVIVYQTNHTMNNLNTKKNPEATFCQQTQQQKTIKKKILEKNTLTQTMTYT